MNIEQLFLKRQSTRKYEDKPVDDELLVKVCSLASLAPSACNSQPWKMIALNGKKAKGFAKFVKISGINGWADTCPAFIVIKQEKAVLPERIGQAMLKSDFVGNDIGILAAHLVLAAEDLGLQTCILGMRDEKGIAEYLNLPDGSKFPLIIAIGYAEEGAVIRKKARKDFDKIFELIKE
ncbi:MAG: NAD(P)H nitroreductase [Clostridiales bacterium]|nr:NAD(P)H nitroreductase [Clostridiales bacterium]